MNMQYVVAVTALEGEVFIDQFSDEKINDPRIIAYSRKVQVVPDPDLDKLGPEFRHTVIAEVKTKDGKTLSERVDSARGSGKKPLSDDEVLEKYARLAGRVLTETRVAELRRMVFNLEAVSDVRDLAHLLTV
jgi:2-methylcitrate dehydratase PrpD